MVHDQCMYIHVLVQDQGEILFVTNIKIVLKSKIRLKWRWELGLFLLKITPSSAYGGSTYGTFLERIRSSGLERWQKK